MLNRRPLRLVLPRFRAAELHIFARQLPARIGRSALFLRCPKADIRRCREHGPSHVLASSGAGFNMEPAKTKEHSHGSPGRTARGCTRPPCVQT